MYALAERRWLAPISWRITARKVAGTRAYLGFMRGQWIESETAFRNGIVAIRTTPKCARMYSQLLGAVGHIGRRTGAGTVGSGD